jgi:hypothetical protein
MNQSLTLATKGYWNGISVAFSSKGIIDTTSFLVAGCPIILISKGVLGDVHSLASHGILCPSRFEYVLPPSIPAAILPQSRPASRAKYREAKRYEITREDRKIRVTVFCDGVKYVSVNTVPENIRLKVANVKVEFSPLPKIIIQILR